VADRVVGATTTSTAIVACRVISAAPTPGHLDQKVGGLDTRMAGRIIGAAATATTTAIVTRRIVRAATTPRHRQARVISRSG
jgi:hypothetical protein